MAVTTYYLIRNNSFNPPFYGGNGTWVEFDNAQLFSSKETVLSTIDTLTNGTYYIQEKIVKS
jgi:hypothetical protein